MARRKPRTFQTSVVTILAAFAPLGACDSEQTSEVEETGDAEATGDGAQATSDGGLAASCPATPPADGTPCAAADESLSCVYEHCALGVRAVCEQRAFRVRTYPSSCNPPWFFDGSLPDAASDASSDAAVDASSDAGDDCPAAIPMEGASCSAELECVYGTCASGEVLLASCQAGSVRLLRVSCNPPPLDWSMQDAGSDASLDATL